MRKIISLICLLLPIAAYADELRVQENAPERYIVVKGDTLWDISAKFFKDPWKWQQIWGLNKETIKDPHWIYPGNVVYIDPKTHTLRVAESFPSNTTSAPASVDSTGSGIVKLSPHAREMKGESTAIQTISLKDIGPFLVRPLVVDEKQISVAPKIVGTYEQRQLLGTGDIAYVEGIPSEKGERWQIYRPDRIFKDPVTGEVLGREVVYLGEAVVEKFDKLSSLRITNSILEINIGDRLAQSTTGFASNYQPHAPDKNISAQVIAVYGGVVQAGQNAVVTINKGARDGVENGHVLALYQKGEVIRNPGLFKPNTVLPDMRYGLLFVFRVFEKVSYALVMETKLPVQLLDRASTPE